MKNKIICFQNGAILAKLTKPNYNKDGKFIINSKEFQIGDKSNIEVVISSIPESIQYKSKSKELDCYQSKDNKEKTMSLSDFAKTREVLLKNADSNDEFDNLDDEYKFKKFIGEWAAVYKDVDHEQDVEFSTFKCLEIPIEYKDHIVSLYHEPNFDFSDHYVRLNINPTIIIKETFEKYGIELVKDCGVWGSDNTKGLKGSIPKDSSWEFSKINSNYVFGSGFAKQFQLSLNCIKIDHAISRINSFKNAIDKAVKIEYNKISNSKKIDFKELSTDLQSILAKVRSIESKAKTSIQYSSAINKINELIEKLNK